MKKELMRGLMEQIQSQNLRLRDEIVRLRKQLNTFENTMMNQLLKLDSKNIIYQTPYDCLRAFIVQLQSITEKEGEKKKSIEDLNLKVKVLQHKFEVQRLNNIELSRKNQKYVIQINDLQNTKKQEENKLNTEIKELRKIYSKIKADFQEIQLKFEQKEIAIEQEKRVSLAAANLKFKRQMLEYRQEIQKQLMRQTQKLRDQIKIKDERIKQVIKGIQKYQNGVKNDPSEFSEMKKIIKQLGNIEELNQKIIEQRDQIYTLKKEIKDIANKKVSLQIKINELKSQISNQKAKVAKKQEEINQLKKDIQNLNQQIKLAAEQTKKLQNYYEQKWHNQFQKVKNHLQKVYNQKILLHEKELQSKKSDVSRKIQYYLFVHSEDQKIIEDLKQKINIQCQQSIDHQKEIVKLGDQIQEMKREMVQNNRMMVEDQLTWIQELKNRLARKNEYIFELQDKISSITANQHEYQQKIQQMQIDLKLSFQHQKQQIKRQYLAKIEIQSNLKEQQIEDIKDNHRQVVNGMKKETRSTVQGYQFKIITMQAKFQKEIEKMNEEIQQEKKVLTQFTKTSEKKEKEYKKEILDVKNYFLTKINNLEIEVESKSSKIKNENIKSENDENIKKELRELLDSKILQVKELTRMKQDLMNQIQAKDSQINHLNHENTGLRLTKDDWLNIIIEVRNEFNSDLQFINNNHIKQMNLFKSKIWELQSIISRRPIRFQDEKKIRNLSQQKKVLQNKVDLKQAENIILKQIKHYYEKKNEITTHSSQMNLTTNDFARPNSISILNKRPKRNKLTYNDLKRNSEEVENQTNRDIKKMKKYLIEKGRQNGPEQNIRNNYNNSTRFYNHVSIQK